MTLKSKVSLGYSSLSTLERMYPTVLFINTRSILDLPEDAMSKAQYSNYLSSKTESAHLSLVTSTTARNPFSRTVLYS